MDCVSNPVSFGGGPQAWLLNSESRLHLQHGPIDLIIDAVGSSTEVGLAYKQATLAFKHILDCLAAQLPLLRSNYSASSHSAFIGPVANRMQKAVQPLLAFNVTPMIAVAGAVADHVLSQMIVNRTLERALVNNGGDIAVFMSEGASVKVGICTDPEIHNHHTNSARQANKSIITLAPAQGVGGVATSGWQGRSHSLGIADAVTVLADSAACADAAATLIANAVDIPGSTKVIRTPAKTLEADSDLRERLVTIMVTPLDIDEKNRALLAGEKRAQKLISSTGVRACFIHLQGESRVIGDVPITHQLATSN